MWRDGGVGVVRQGMGKGGRAWWARVGWNKKRGWGAAGAQPDEASSRRCGWPNMLMGRLGCCTHHAGPCHTGPCCCCPRQAKVQCLGPCRSPWAPCKSPGAAASGTLHPPSSASKAAIASPRLVGSRAMPAASRAASLIEPGSVVAGCGSRRPCCKPSSPAAAASKHWKQHAHLVIDAVGDYVQESPDYMIEQPVPEEQQQRAEGGAAVAGAGGCSVRGGQALHHARLHSTAPRCTIPRYTAP